MPGGAELFENSGSRNFYHKDWLGSVRFQSTMGSRGVNVDRAFAPFGETYAGVTNPSIDPDFTGDHQDDVTGVRCLPSHLTSYLTSRRRFATKSTCDASMISQCGSRGDGQESVGLAWAFAR